MPELNPLTNEQIFLKKIAENTGSNYNTGDVSEINPLTIDQILLKEIAANTAGQSGDITELEEKVADNTSAIGAIVNENGCCNVFAIDNPISLDNAEVANNGIINTDTDTAGAIDLMFRAYVNGSYVILAQDIPLTTGNKSYDVTIPDNATKLQLKHNGVQRDIAIEIPTVPAGDYKLTMSVIGIDPSVVGGFEITNIMLYDARLKPTGYVPYAMTNRELTERVNRGGVSVVADGVKTYKQLLNELYVKIDVTKLSQLSEIKSVANWGTYYYGLNGYSSTEISFTSTMTQSDGVYNETYTISSDSIFRKYSNGAVSDESSTIASASQTLTLIY